MNKYLIKDSDEGDWGKSKAGEISPKTKNYITPFGYNRLRTELLSLIDDDRPKVVEAVYWAASNGDRSENGDYIYGKKRLREIDRRIRFLTQRLELAEVVDPSIHYGRSQIFFGASVTYKDQLGKRTAITIVGIDEVGIENSHVSWVSPIAKILIKAEVGDICFLKTPSGGLEIEILDVRYPKPK